MNDSNTDEATRTKIFQIFVNSVKVDGKWWKMLVDWLTNKGRNEEKLRQLILQVWGAVSEQQSTNEPAGRGLQFTLREGVLLYLNKQKRLPQDLQATLAQCIYALNEKEPVLVCIRKQHDELVNVVLPRIVQTWNKPKLVEIFCEIATRRDANLLQWLKVSAEAVAQWCTQMVEQNILIDEPVLRRLILTVQLTIQNHILKLERGDFAVQAFLIAFFKLTFSNVVLNADNLEVYMECLEAWSCLSLSISDDEKREKFYEGCIRELMPKILSFSLFTQEGSRIMTQLDGTVERAFHETEVDEYLARCVDTLAVICSSSTSNNHFTSSIFQLMVQIVTRYQSQQNFSSTEAHHLARDSHTMLLLFSQFASFLLDAFETYRGMVEQFLRGSIGLTKFIADNRIYFQGRAHQSLFVNCLHTYQTFFPWLRHTLSLDAANARVMIHALIDLCVGCLMKETPSWITQEAANTFVRLVASLRYTHTHEVESFQQLCQRLPQFTLSESSLKNLAPKIHLAVSTSILLPHRDGELHNTAWKQKMYGLYFTSSVLEPLNAFLQSADFSSNPHSTSSTTHLIVHLKVLHQLLKSIQDQNLTVRNIFFEQFAPMRTTILQLFNVYKTSSVMSDTLLSLLQSIFKSLHAQIGVEFIESTMNALMQSLSRPDNVAQIIQNNNGKKFVKKLLTLQTTLLADGNHRFRPLLPSYLNTAKELIYVVISQDTGTSTVEIKSDFYYFLYTSMHQHFKYFEENLKDFSFALQCFLDSLSSLDINTVHMNLNYLRNLNASHRLFKVSFFQEYFAQHYIQSLVRILKSRNHELNNDRIITALYEICTENGFTELFQMIQREDISARGTQKVTEPKFQSTIMDWIYA